MAIVKDLSGSNKIVDRTLVKSNRNVGTKSFAVVPSDTVNFARIPRKIQVGVGGTVTVVNLDDTTTQYTVPTGGVIDQECKRINATGTAASLIVGIL